MALNTEGAPTDILNGDFLRQVGVTAHRPTQYQHAGDRVLVIVIRCHKFREDLKTELDKAGTDVGKSPTGIRSRYKHFRQAGQTAPEHASSV